MLLIMLINVLSYLLPNNVAVHVILFDIYIYLKDLKLYVSVFFDSL